jgi:hypothetical protein
MSRESRVLTGPDVDAAQRGIREFGRLGICRGTNDFAQQPFRSVSVVERGGDDAADERRRSIADERAKLEPPMRARERQELLVSLLRGEGRRQADALTSWCDSTRSRR